MRRRARKAGVRRALRAAAAALLAVVLACGGGGSGTQEYEAHGVVRDLDLEERQLLIEHEDIPGLMPAMTMSFDVADPALFEGLSRGQVVHFTLVREGQSYVVTGVEVLGTKEGGLGARFSELLGERDVAPEFALIDQDGRTVALSDLRGKAVVLDFIFTHCTGPCPVLTGLHVDLQKALPPDVRARTRLVSITLDPARDRPEVLKRYAKARGADLSDWSFLTGGTDEVDAVVKTYGVGKVERPGEELQHLVATFVIDPQGRIADRLVGLDDPVAERVGAVESALGVSGQSVQQ